jgi:AhpD family alkylhydroperoxidase
MTDIFGTVATCRICFELWPIGRIFETIIAHMEAVLNTGTLPKALKELVTVRTSQLNRTPYCQASDTKIARNLGWSDVQMKRCMTPLPVKSSANGRRSPFISQK